MLFPKLEDTCAQHQLSYASPAHGRKKSNYDCAFAIVPNSVARLRIRLSEPDELPEVIRHKH